MDFQLFRVFIECSPPYGVCCFLKIILHWIAIIVKRLFTDFNVTNFQWPTIKIDFNETFSWNFCRFSVFNNVIISLIFAPPNYIHQILLQDFSHLISRHNSRTQKLFSISETIISSYLTFLCMNLYLRLLNGMIGFFIWSPHRLIEPFFKLWNGMSCMSRCSMYLYNVHFTMNDGLIYT